MPGDCLTRKGQRCSQHLCEVPASLHAYRAAHAPAGTVDAAGLTERELDVLRLVARGLSDADVAAELVVSVRTVNAHLRSIYGKLDVNSRAAATRAALERKLI